MDPTAPLPSPSGNEPWWAVAGGSAVGLVVVAARAYFWIRNRLTTARTEEKSNEASQREADRRAAVAEAWELNQRLMEIIKGYDTKYDSLIKRHDDARQRCEDERRKCEVELAEMCGRLSVIESWAKKKGMPLETKGDADTAPCVPQTPITGGS